MATALDAGLTAVRSGRLVVYPTDTLFGLGADARNPEAVARLLAAKARPGGMPISVIVSSTEEVEEWATLSPMARTWLRRELPGPWTLLLSASPRARRELAAPLLGPNGSLGVRVPDHPVARELARQVGVLTATSANSHGAPPCRTIPEARRVFGTEVAAYITAGPAPKGVPSGLVDLRGSAPRIVPRS
jgi:L-threonylcarbamoyladenylate synthase